MPRVTKIGSSGFGHSLLSSIFLPSLISADQWAFVTSKLTTAFLPSLQTAGETCFYNNPLNQLIAPRLQCTSASCCALCQLDLIVVDSIGGKAVISSWYKMPIISANKVLKIDCECESCPQCKGNLENCL
jgi:hypothetical protein